LLETYEAGGQKVLHLDLYRIEDPEELEFLALRDLFDERSVLLIEWPDRGSGHLPDADLVLEFGELTGGRYIDCSGQSDRGRALARAVARSS
jgi:tRNA threonylcarbamoyladenosine biosynthesis protein TsaE